MRITGWHVDAFGALQDVGIQGLPPGVVVLHGPNEAGKSTLLAFLQRTLFGHPHRNRQDVNHYEPRSGGPRGGRVHLTDTRSDGLSGEIVVERHDGRGLQVLLPDATVGGQQTLDELVHGADHRLFSAVFAFDLDELRSIDSLTDEAVRDRLFSAGVRGAGRSARAVLDHLDAEARALWTPRSRTARIDRVQEELAEVGRELDEAVRVAAGYPERVARERHCEQELAATDELCRELEAEQRRVEVLLGAWPVWQRRCEAERELATMPDCPELPDDVLERHERLCARLEATDERLAGLDEEARALEERLGASEVDTGLLALGDEISSLDAERSAQLERLDRLVALTDEQRRVSDELERAVTALGPGWDHRAEPPVEPSIATRGALRDWEARLEQAHRARDDAEHELGERTRDRDRAASKLEEIDGSLAAMESDGPLPTPEELERERERLVQLRVALLQRDATSPVRASVPSSRDTTAPPAWLVPVIGGTAAALAVAGTWAAIRGATTVLATLLVVALGLLAVAAAVRRRRGADAPAPGGDADAGARLTATINERAADLGLPQHPSFEDAEAHTLRLEQLRSLRSRADELREARAHAAQRLRDAQRDHDRASRAHERAAREVAQATRQWRAWCAEHGLPPDVSPATVADLLTEWERIVDRRQHLEAVETGIDTIRAASSSFRARATELLSAVGRTPVPDDPRQQVEELRRLAGVFAAARNRAEERRRLQERAEEIELERLREEERQQALRRERAQLLTAAGADDEDQLRQVVERSRYRAELTRRRRDADRDLADRLGDDGDDLWTQLSIGDHDAWIAARDRLRQERRELESSRDEVLETLLEARRAREEVETSEWIAELERHRQVLLTRRDELVEQWRVARTARRLVADTLEGFESERQPAVLRRAGSHFSQVTGDAYRALLQRGDELLVQDAQQRICTVDQLSRGTAEQLYLCLRLSLAEDLSERGQRLPFVMDDVLVNLDPERSEQLARLLGRVGQQAQILYFTCHPHMAKRLRELAVATVYDLPRGGGVPVPR